MLPFLRKYGVAITAGTAYAVRIPLIKRGVTDYAASADWTPAAGDVKVQLDGAAAASIATLPTAIVSGNGSVWEFVFSAAEMQAKTIVVTIVDAATKAIEDDQFTLETYGHASAMYQSDLSAANLAANVLAWGGDGAGIAVDAQHLPKVDLEDWKGAAAPANTGDAYSIVNDGTFGNAVLHSQISTLNNLSAAQVENAVWDGLLNSHAVTGSFGLLVKTNLDTTVGSRSTYAGADTAGTTTLLSLLTSDRAGYLDNLSEGAAALHSDALAIAAAINALGNPLQAGTVTVGAYAAGQDPWSQIKSAVPSSAPTTGQLEWILRLLDADAKIDTATTPWTLKEYVRGTNTLLRTRRLFDVAGGEIGDTSTVLGEALQ